MPKKGGLAGRFQLLDLVASQPQYTGQPFPAFLKNKKKEKNKRLI